MQTVRTRGLSAGSLFKFLFCGSLIPFFLFGTICGIAGFFGANAITWNGQYIYGATGLIGGVVLGLLLPMIFTLLFWVILLIGTWLWNVFFGPLNLKLKS